MHEEFEVIRAQLRLAENDLNRGRPAKLGKRFHIITTKLKNNKQTLETVLDLLSNTISTIKMLVEKL